MRADLHVHSTASDGTLTPPELVALAIAAGLSVLAICDHDSVEGVPAALSASEGSDLTLVPAVELSAVSGDYDIHVIGYFVRHLDPHLSAHLADLRDARMRRAETTVLALRAAGIAVELGDVLALAGGGAVGRSHVARALVAGGHASTIPEAFRRFIGRGRPFYTPKDARTPAEVIGVVKDAGGLAVLAHPGVNELEHLIPELVDAGLDGIEAYHADHSAEQRERYAGIAAARGLFVTGGSDFHGPEAPNARLGSVEVPPSAIDALLAWKAVRP